MLTIVFFFWVGYNTMGCPTLSSLGLQEQVIVTNKWLSSQVRFDNCKEWNQKHTSSTGEQWFILI